MSRQRKYSSDAEKQAAYRERKRNTMDVTKTCPYCHEDVFDVTGRVRFFERFGQKDGRVYLCVSCSAYITLRAGQTTMWNIVIKPNLASITN